MRCVVAPSASAAIAGAEDAMTEQVSGACVCGAVTYEAEGPFFAFQNCYCSRCRKASGAGFASNLFVMAPQFRWTAGEQSVRCFDHPDAKYWRHTFCDTCGSAVPYVTRTNKAYVIPAGTLDVAPAMRPERNIHFASKPDWYAHPHELPTFDGYPKRES